METIGDVRVEADDSCVLSVEGGATRLTPNAGLRLAEALVRASFRAALRQEVAASDPHAAPFTSTVKQ